MLSNIILVLICILRLSKEYIGLSEDFKKAKVFHSITSVILILITAYSIKNLEVVLRNYNLFMEGFNNTIGILTPIVRIINFYIHMIVSILIFINTFYIMARNEKSRSYLIYLMIITIPFSAISLYELQKPAGHFNDLIIFIIGIVVYSVFFGGIALIYNNKFMIDFFSSKRKHETISTVLNTKTDN